MTDNAEYVLRIALTNETEGYMFSEFDDDCVPLKGDGTPDLGTIYRAMQSEYGRCRGGMFRDRKVGNDWKVIRTGWVFESRQKYEDSGEPYLRGAWVEIQEVIPEVRKPFAIKESA